MFALKEPNNIIEFSEDDEFLPRENENFYLGNILNVKLQSESGEIIDVTEFRITEKEVIIYTDDMTLAEGTYKILIDLHSINSTGQLLQNFEIDTIVIG